MRSRTVALLAVLAIATIISLGAPLAAPARADSGLTSPVLAGTGWAVSQLTGGNHAAGAFGPDHGLTADVLLGLAATGAADATSRATAAWLAEHAQAYIDGGYAGDVSAGAVAKLALVARSVGADPSSFGGLDLDAILLGRLQPSGRFTDALTDSGPQPLDLSNVFTQALAVLALRQGSVAPASAVDFLAQQRCAAGGYPVFYPARPQDCLPDADGTGVAVQALLAVGRTADAAPAVNWLVAQQAPDGSFRNGGPGAVPNTNSTALAAQALRDAGRIAEADAAVAWLLTRQVGCSAPTADRGAIGYAEPIADASALRATAQALAALAGVSLADSDDLVGSGPDQVPVPLCTATTSPTTTTTTTTTAATTTTTRATTTTAASTSTASTTTASTTTASTTTASTTTTTEAAWAAGRSRQPSGASTTPPASPAPASTTPPSQPPTPTTVVFEGDEEASPEDPDSLSAASDSTTPASGETGAPGIPWWVGAVAVLVAAAVWLGATGRLTRRSAA